jgi:hypothetical protein
MRWTWYANRRVVRRPDSGQERNHDDQQAKEKEGKDNGSADLILLGFGIVAV